MRNGTDTIQGAMTAADVAGAAQRQYFSRPADEKFENLDDLYAVVSARRNRSVDFEADITDVTAQRSDTGLVLASKGQIMTPTHWAFGQACALVGAPAAYLRKLGQQGAEDLVVENLNHSIKHRDAAGLKFLAVDSPDPNSDVATLYATTSPTYGRIWDADVVKATKTLIDSQNGTFYSPWAWGKKHRALFGGSQSIFTFFIDGGSIVDGGGDRDQLHRGIYIWNSEVGAATFGIATFLFRACCGNFCIWDAQRAKIVNIRHTSGGPERFINEAIPALNEFAHSSVKELEAGVKAAKNYALPTDPEKVIEFAMKHGFTRAEARRAIDHANAEEGQCATLWDLSNGITASARLIAYADAKVDLETRAGKLLKLAEGKAPLTTVAA